MGNKENQNFAIIPSELVETWLIEIICWETYFDNDCLFLSKEKIIFVFLMMIMKKVTKAVINYCGDDDDYEIIEGVDDGS